MSPRKKTVVHMPSAAKSKAAAAKSGRNRKTEGHQQIIVDVEVNEVKTEADDGVHNRDIDDVVEKLKSQTQADDSGSGTYIDGDGHKNSISADVDSEMVDSALARVDNSSDADDDQPPPLTDSSGDEDQQPPPLVSDSSDDDKHIQELFLKLAASEKAVIEAYMGNTDKPTTFF